jgi:hypothetical protein
LQALDNKLTYSQDPSQAIWNKANLTITTGAIQGPDGAMSGTRLLVASTAATLLNQNQTATSTINTCAFIVKGGTKASLSFLMRNMTTSTNFDIGTFTTATGLVSGVGWTQASLGNGWYLLAYTRSAGVTIGDSIAGYFGALGNSGTGGEDYYFYRAGLFPGSYTASQVAALGIPWTLGTASVSLSLGPELASTANSTLSNTTGYISGMNVAPVVSKNYWVGYNYNLASGQVQAGSGSSFTTGTAQAGPSSGYYSYAAVGNGTNASFALYANAATGSVSNFSVREILSTPCPVYTDAHVYIPGAGGVAVSGLTTSNYTSNDGSTGYSAIDGTAGLVLDAAGSVGAELVTNGTNLVTTTGWTANGGATLSVVSGALRVTNGTAAFGFAAQSFATVIGQTYYIPPFYVDANPANTVNYHIGAGPGGATDVTGANAALPKFFVASQTTSYISVYAGSNTIANYTDYNNISVKPVTGIHASQSTAGNRPVLRRGLYNQLLWANDISNASWITGFTASKTGSNQINFPAASDKLTQGAAASSSTVGTPWTQAFMLSGTGTVRLFLYDNGGAFPGTQSADIVLTSTPTIYVVNRTHSDATATAMSAQVFNNSATPATVYCGGFGLFKGTLTAAQILSEGGIPLTTAAAASNSGAGRYSWYNDGTKSMNCGSVPLQMSDDFVIVGSVQTDNIGTRALFSQASTVSANPLIELGVITGLPRFATRDDAGTVSAPSAAASIAGTWAVIAARKVGNTKEIWVNGVLTASDPTALGATTFNSAAIGVRPTAGTANYMVGSQGPLEVIKGTFSNADLITLMRQVAANTPACPTF